MGGGRDYIIVAGGFEDSYTVSNKVEILSMHSRGYLKQTWQMVASVNINRFDFGLAMYGSQLAAFGGQPPIESDQIEVYNPETNCWKIVGQRIANSERQFFTAITVPDSYFQETPTTPSYTNPPVYPSPPKYTEAPVYPTAPSYMEPVPEDEDFATVLVGGCDNDIGIK